MKNNYNILRVVSPSQYGGETKNQDRAVFHGPSSVAALCDGVTSSPNSAEAAKIITQNAGLIFDNQKGNLAIITRLLLAYRKMAINTGVTISKSIPEPMKELLIETAQKNLSQSYQSTFIGVNFLLEKKFITVKMINFGDSGFFAFSPEGKILMSNLSDECQTPPVAKKNHKMVLTPGVDILATVIDDISSMPRLCKNAKNINPHNWIVCRAMCNYGKKRRVKMNKLAPRLYLKTNELIVVPKYLTSIPKDCRFKDLRRLMYSKFIKPVSSLTANDSVVSFDERGNTTAVLPDHYGSNQSISLKERFPLNTDFLLCSDGFYRCFTDSGQMWQWLKKNQDELGKPNGKKKLLESLHATLNETCGNDDISFIWIEHKEVD